MGQKQNKQFTVVVPLDTKQEETKLYGSFYTLEKVKIPSGNKKFTGYGFFHHRDNILITGHFVDDQVTSVESINIKKTIMSFTPKEPITDLDVLQKINILMISPNITNESIIELMNGEGKMDHNSAEYFGEFKNGVISVGVIKYNEYYSYEGEMKEYEPFGNGKLITRSYTLTGYFAGGYDKIRSGTIEYKNGDIYKGDLEWSEDVRSYYCSYKLKQLYKHGFGVFHTKEYILQCAWDKDFMITNMYPQIYKYSNGLIREKHEDRVILRVKLNATDFKLDMDYMSKMFLNPPKVDENKEIYDMIFTGKIQDNFPIKGDLHIYKVFKFTNCEWNSRKELECEGKLYDLINAKIYNVIYTDGVKMIHAVKMVNDIEKEETDAVPEFHEEEGAAQN